MNRRSVCAVCFFILFFVFGPCFLSAQGTQADYERAFGLREKLSSLVLNMPERPFWIDKTNRFWYRKSVKGGSAFYLVDAEALKKERAFDHKKLAASLSKLLEEEVEPLKLPFRFITFIEEEKSLEFEIGEWKYTCDLTTYEVKKAGPAEHRWRPRDFTMWERGPAPKASSNVDNAYRLQGKLLLIVGELDTNVDPSSTMQVVDALIKADKTFDLLVIPGGGHGMGGAYGERKMYDFFVQHLQGITPPNWNEIEKEK